MTNSTRGELTIGPLARRTGCSVPTIRYYEQIGLMPAARRRASGHRVYDAGAEERLAFIRRCRDFGFPVEQVRELVALSQSSERDCSETLEIAKAQLRAVRDRLVELRALETSLARLAAACAEQCAGGPAANCSIPRDIAQPGGPRGCCG
ncbi:MAG: helix-turn-helix domain-containing protein [Burkholderiales bacterium]|nr:helix-turn-helix domain-containing protein [Burkholderiales bacterium]